MKNTINFKGNGKNIYLNIVSFCYYIGGFVYNHILINKKKKDGVGNSNKYKKQALTSKLPDDRKKQFSKFFDKLKSYIGKGAIVGSIAISGFALASACDSNPSAYQDNDGGIGDRIVDKLDGGDGDRLNYRDGTVDASMDAEFTDGDISDADIVDAEVDADNTPKCNVEGTQSQITLLLPENGSVEQNGVLFEYVSSYSEFEVWHLSFDVSCGIYTYHLEMDGGDMTSKYFLNDYTSTRYETVIIQDGNKTNNNEYRIFVNIRQN